MKEFADKGFEFASTNQIVKDAEIGKGMLFYYFKSKKDLFFYLIDYCMDTIATEYMGLIDQSERDFLKRMRGISIIKMEFLKRYPDAINFLSIVLLQDIGLLNAKQRTAIEKFQKEMTELIYGNVDLTLFREDIDAEKAFKLIRWMMNGYEEEMKKRLLTEEKVGAIDYEPYFEEFFTYLEVLRTAFYLKEDM